MLNNLNGRKSENGITFTKNEDGTITANGTSIAVAYYNITRQSLPAGTYTLSGTPEGGGNTTYHIISKYGGNYQIDNGDSATFTIEETTVPTEFYIEIRNGVTLNDVVFKPMIEKGTKAHSYSPYGQAPIEFCKIGSYQDFPYKAINGDEYYDSLTATEKSNLTYGSWYKHKEISKRNITVSTSITHYNGLHWISFPKPQDSIMHGAENFKRYKLYSGY